MTFQLNLYCEILFDDQEKIAPNNKLIIQKYCWSRVVSLGLSSLSAQFSCYHLGVVMTSHPKTPRLMRKIHTPWDRRPPQNNGAATSEAPQPTGETAHGPCEEHQGVDRADAQPLLGQ